MKKNILIILVLVIAAGAGIYFSKSSPQSPQNSSKATYYCPMHPTYTSDKPGDCPICNMRLVKKEGGPSAAVASQQKESKQPSQKTQDICYLHNCPHMRGGQPCPMLVVAKEGEKVTCPICGTHVVEKTTAPKEKKILYWTDPMIPGFKSDKPGKSPMGMDMVPVYEEETSMGQMSENAPAGYSPVLLTPQKQQLIGVKTAAVEMRSLKKTIRAVGTIAHDPELYQSQAEYIQAVQAFERAKQSSIPEVAEQSQKLVESTRIRLRHLGLSEDLINEIATWKEPEHSLLFAHPGEPVWIYAKVYEYELPLIKVGQKVNVDVPSLPGETFEGTIRAIDLMVDEMTRTTRIRVQLLDVKGLLKPDMYVNATIDIDVGNVLSTPQEAIFDTGMKKIVFIDKGQGIFEPRDVVVGVTTEGFAEVKEGLQEGEMVVTSGNFLIDSESRLKAALEGMTTTETSARGGDSSTTPAPGGGDHRGHQH